MLKHETGPKERLNKTERRKRVMEAREKEKVARSGKMTGRNPKAGGPAAAGKREPEVPSYKGTGRPTQPSATVATVTAGVSWNGRPTKP
ncbi:hypothetical protein PHISCL_10775, partial [Aspergillus sclerotialis]